MYKKISIERFRGVGNLELKNLKQFNLFVGKNNCGKTTILESIFLLSGPTNVDLPVIINNFRGFNLIDSHSWTLIFNKLNSRFPICFTGEWSSPKEKRELIIKPLNEKSIYKPANGQAHLTLTESRTIREERINGLALAYSVSRGNNKNLEKCLSEIWWAEGKLERRFSHANTGAIKGVFIYPRTVIEDTARRFNEVQIRKQENLILKILQKVEPDLVDLSIGAENVLYCDIGFNKRLPINAVGEGLNRLLSIILAVYDSSGGIVLIDEIENGLHYSAQEVLWEAIFTAARAFNVQLFASTHSFENIRAFSVAHEKFQEDANNLRLFRIEKEKDQLQLIDFDARMLKVAIDSDWEVR